jgi:sialate O-acetylesterase
MKKVFLVPFLALISLRATAADLPFVAPLFGDGMVLQRDQADPIWGWAKPGEKVTVTMGEKTATAVADKDGKWIAKITPPPAGGPYEVKISGPEEVTLKDVLVGDVWICSGQSNMEMGIKAVKDAQQEIANANNPNIRLFLQKKANAASPVATTDGTWLPCTSENIVKDGWDGFTAVGYFFGRELQGKLNVPIGLIETSWGGTVAEAWTSREALKKAMPDFDRAIANVDEVGALVKAGKYDPPKMLNEWMSQSGVKPDISTSSFDASNWKTMRLPQQWENSGDTELVGYDGVVLFRRTFNVPAEAAGKAATLKLGVIDDADVTWINGTKVGSATQVGIRSYDVPEGVLKAGENVIGVWVLDTMGLGGIMGDPASLSLEVAGAPAVSLAGDWQYKRGQSLAELPARLFEIKDSPNFPSKLYNAMIAPLVPYGIKGAIWYQGESNASRAYQYRKLLPTMIQDWRDQWGQGPFPFYIVQLANFMAPADKPSDSEWAELREAQAIASKALPNVGLITAIDIGEANDIHPKNKQEVGRRLAVLSLFQTYGQSIPHAGPIYQSMKVEGDKVRLIFKHSANMYPNGGGEIKGFAIAGEDKVFHWANATIDDRDVIVSSPDVPKPVAVRYDWGNNPDGNLFNKAGLPAFPFRTDDWPGVTVNNK